ncbi:MAG: hypothetical protein KO202_08060 [Methanobacteriaceae archaeon]|nr:hypothetical protein [Methanobacteriaceae archaeon]
MFEKSFISDCEGPLTLNDNAYEMCEYFIDSGDKLFKTLSLFDDYLVDVIKKSDYNAGNTLKLIIPFLKAENISNDDLINFSKKNILEISYAKDSLNFIKRFMNSYIVSTSYGQYISAVCDYMDFPFDKTFYTFLNLDSFKINNDEINKIKEFKNIIINLDPEKNKDLKVLDDIFFNQIPKMGINKYLSKIKTVGGIEKQLAIEKIISDNKIDKNNIFYIGDSITDCEPLNYARKNNGISISFNGNIYSLKEAEIAIVSINSIPTALIADIYSKFDKKKVLEFIKDYNTQNNLKELFNIYDIDLWITQKFFESFSNYNYPIIKIIDKNNLDFILKNSKKIRTEIRGQAISNLG